MEAIRERETLNQIATHFGVHPNQVGQWRKQLMERLDELWPILGRRPEAPPPPAEKSTQVPAPRMAQRWSVVKFGSQRVVLTGNFIAQ